MNYRNKKLGTPPSRRNRVHHVNLDPEQPQSLVEIAREAIEEAGGGSVLAIGSRVGEVEHLPPGYLAAPCCECNLMVWVNADSIREFEVHAVCTRCAGLESAK